MVNRIERSESGWELCEYDGMLIVYSPSHAIMGTFDDVNEALACFDLYTSGRATAAQMAVD